jgi:hypothetical protein
MREDVYSRVTARIIADLEQGVRPWLKPWSAATPPAASCGPCAVSGVPYQGLNVLVLWSELRSGATPRPHGSPIDKPRSSAGRYAEANAAAPSSMPTRSNALKQTAQARRANGDPVPQVLRRVQHRADQRLARALLPSPPSPASIRCSAVQAPEGVHRRDRRPHPARRHPGLLLPRAGSHPNAAVRELPGRGELLRHGAS